MTLTIAALQVAGGTLALCPMPGRGGDYAGDLADVLAFAPTLVISMATLPEMAAKRADGLADDLARQGIGWLHLPVADFGVPGPDVAALWPGVSAQALATLSGGGKVLVHCMGGCGRSGMAVLRLMVDAGETPTGALIRLRAVRPCAVETDAQQDWAATPLP